MKTAIALAVVALAAVAVAEPVGLGVGIAKDIYAYPAYKFSYGVADKLTGDHKNHFEVRDGPVTKGSYSLVQPDGVLRTVNYISTPVGGFQAQVINKGVAGHPAIYGIGKGIGLGGGIGIGGGLGRGIGGIGLGGIGHHGIGGIGLGGIGHHGIGGIGLGGIGGGIIG